MTKKHLISIVFLSALLCPVNGYSIVAPYIDITVHGRTYSVPIPNVETKNTFFYLKKALKGDPDAREIVLGGAEKKAIFIGDRGVVRWLTITKDSEEVTEIPS